MYAFKFDDGLYIPQLTYLLGDGQRSVLRVCSCKMGSDDFTQSFLNLTIKIAHSLDKYTCIRINYVIFYSNTYSAMYAL